MIKSGQILLYRCSAVRTVYLSLLYFNTIQRDSSPKNKYIFLCESFFLLLNTKEAILKNVGKQTIKILQKSMATVSCLVTNILQNISFYAQQKKETHTGLEQVERGEMFIHRSSG